MVRPASRSASRSWSDPTVFEVDHRFVLLNELGWHDRSGALLFAATGDVGDLTTEGSPVHGVGEVIPRLADAKFGQVCVHASIRRQVRQLGWARVP